MSKRDADAPLRQAKSAERALSADESNRLARLAKIWTQALHVWKSDGEARDFLFPPGAGSV